MRELQAITNAVRGSVQHIDALMGSVEAVALAVSTRAAAWLSTIPTVMLTSRTIEAVFALSPAAALLSSIALEVVGQATADLWLSAKEWNGARRKTDPAANERLAFSMMCVYFAADFVLISVLELPRVVAGELGHLAALLFPVMQVVSTLALTERAKQFRRVAAIETEKAERTQERAERRTQGRAERISEDVLLHAERTASTPITYSLENLDAANRTREAEKEAAIERLLDAYRADPSLSFADAGRSAGRSKSWAAATVRELERVGTIRKNGHGVEIMA